MSHRNELQKVLKIYRDELKYDITLSLTTSQTWRLQEEFDRVSILEKMKQEQQEEIEKEVIKASEENKKSLEDVSSINASSLIKSDISLYGTEAYQEYLKDENNSETLPYFATLSRYALYFLEDFFSPCAYGFRHDTDRLVALYRILKSENTILTKFGVITNDRQMMIRYLNLVSDLPRQNQYAERFIKDYFVMIYNWCLNLGDVDLTTFQRKLKDYSVTENYKFIDAENSDSSKQNQKVFIEMVAMTIFREFFPDYFNDYTCPLPRSRKNWKSCIKEEYILIEKTVRNLFHYVDRRPLKNWSELCQIIDQLTGLGKFEYKIIPGELQSIVIPKHPENPEEGYLSDTMDTPFHQWKNNQILAYCNMIGWDTSPFFTAFSCWDADRKCLLSDIIQHESNTF